MRLCDAGLQETVDVVVELGASGIRIPEVLERAERARDCRGAIDTLQGGSCPRPFDPDTVVVGKAAAGSAALRRDDDGSIGGVDPVERGGFGPLEYRECLDIVRIQVSGSIREVDPAIAQRRI